MEYKKSLADEIDWKIIDQLHAATINFSNASLELKKLFFVLIGIAVPSLIKLAGDKLDISLFVTIYVLAFTFWLLDSFTYFYQEKLREKMDKHFNSIKNRNVAQQVVEMNFTLENFRSKKSRHWRSLFNQSTRLYLFVLVINTFALVLLKRGVI